MQTITLRYLAAENHVIIRIGSELSDRSQFQFQCYTYEKLLVTVHWFHKVFSFYVYFMKTII